MGSLNEQFGTQAQSITCTITSLANAAARQSTAIDNSSNLFFDALVSVKVKTASSSTSANGYVSVYAYATVDGGTTYTDGASGSDGAITPTVPTDLKLIGNINCVANSTTYYGGPFSVAAAFGGLLPQKWGIVIVNNTGATLDASVGAAEYQGVYGEY